MRQKSEQKSQKILSLYTLNIWRFGLKSPEMADDPENLPDGVIHMYRAA